MLTIFFLNILLNHVFGQSSILLIIVYCLIQFVLLIITFLVYNNFLKKYILYQLTLLNTLVLFIFRFYSNIQKLPQITDQELSTTMQQLSAFHFGQFHIVSALKELYIYASKYNDAVSFFLVQVEMFMFHNLFIQ